MKTGLLDARHTLPCRRLAYKVRRKIDRERARLRKLLMTCGLEEGP